MIKVTVNGTVKVTVKVTAKVTVKVFRLLVAKELKAKILFSITIEDYQAVRWLRAVKSD